MTKKKVKPKNKKDMLWAEAKRKCRLNNEDIRMAKELGLNPRSLIKNIPSKSQPWKSPVKEWIRQMYPGYGFRAYEIGDVDVVKHDGLYHLFHLTLPNHDYIAHAVSEDAIRWR